MTPVWLGVERIILIVFALLCAVLLGALAHQRAQTMSRAQGLMRAGMVFVFLTVALSALVGLLDLDPALRVTPPLVAVGYTLIGLLQDTLATIRERPTRGPFAVVSRLLGPRRRR